ncbi:MAG TPA: hypothetical protein VMV33_00485 [Rhodocyclaceae bacterium]|nr:hypothetical protein [Rhodocyclaceae bacterium]
MTTIYIRSNETGRDVDSFTGADNDECEAWALENYAINDYSWGYTRGLDPLPAELS